MLKPFIIISLLVSPQQLKIDKMPLPSRGIRDSTQNYIVLHNDGSNMTARQAHGVLSSRRLSYHYFVTRDGKIYEYVNPKYIARHAGVSFHDGMLNWNKFSIGICLQGMNGLMYSDQQYKSLSRLIQQLHNRYPDSKTRPILTHSEIAFPPGRKKDPGETFDLTKIKLDSM
jgi:N-acetyl-anhydromuramyl-L-alanine amidase AmpD